MKAKLLISAISAFIALSLSAQIPQGFNYQAVARDAAGSPVASTSLQVRLTILSDTVSNVIVWEELHNSIETNPNGVFSLVAGSGERQAASQVATFGDIDWGVPALFLRTSVFYLSQWRPMGTSRLWSVPYAMTAGDLSGSLKRLEVTGEASVDDEALFEVKNKNGQTVFAVYNEGVRVNVGSGESKASKGGFAIGSFDENKAVRDYFVVNSDCVRVYLDNPVAGKAAKGGFAIGSFDEAKAGVDEYLRVTRDSTRVYVSSSAAKASKGGFAIGSFDEAKAGSVESFMNLTPENYLIGHLAGTSLTTGRFNSFFGYESGSLTTSGSNNAFMGYYAGRANTTGNSNVFMGNLSGQSNTTGLSNVFLGNSSGFSNSTGGWNTFLGFEAGYSNNADYNSFIGYRAGRANTTGGYNSFMGYNAGLSNTAGASNVFIGNEAGRSNILGASNVFLGNQAGYSNFASNNVFLGFEAGRQNTTGTNNAFIGYLAGRSNTSGSSNVFIGYNAGRLATLASASIIMGSNSAQDVTTQIASSIIMGENALTDMNTPIPVYSSVIMGNDAGVNIGQGALSMSSSVLIGDGAGSGLNTVTATIKGISSIVAIGNGSGANSDGYRNVFIGNGAGSGYKGVQSTMIGFLVATQDSEGTYNVYLGDQAALNTIGDNNTYIGRTAGSWVRGSNNVFLGINAGKASSGSPRTESSRLRIGEYNLIYGEFDNRRVGINTTTVSNTLTVNGTASKTTAGDWLANSDVRIKTDVEDIDNALETIMMLHPVKFRYSDEWLARYPSIENRVYYNFIAQEYRTVFPELVKGSGEFLEGQTDEVLQIDTWNAQIVAVKAIQELVTENRQLKTELEQLKERMAAIEALLDTSK